MSTRIECSGPVGFYVTTDNGTQYLGTAQTKPRILWRRIFEPVYNDVGGSIPFDMQYMGHDALVIADINKIDQSVLETLQQMPMISAPFGEEPFGSMGTLMIQEGKAATLALVFPYGGGGEAAKPGTKLPSGVTFEAAWLLGPDDQQVGTVHEQVRVIFQCLRTYDEGTGAFRLCSLAAAGTVR